MADPVATPEEVLKLTGASVTENDVEAAATIIEVFAGRDPEVWPKLRERDQRHLKLAVIYQAGWMAAHPEALSMMDVDSFSQLDQSASPRDSAALVLAPLAKRTLKRLSWKGIRSVPVSTAFQRKRGDDDHEGHWSAL